MIEDPEKRSVFDVLRSNNNISHKKNNNILGTCSSHTQENVSIPSSLFASETAILEDKIQASEPFSSVPDRFSDVSPTNQQIANLK
jgi:hypothetical protein